jgi:drug/metabolite transporter (DMT)-like permease
MTAVSTLPYRVPTAAPPAPAPRHAGTGRAAALALLAVTALWGSTFVLLKDTVTRLPVLDLLGVRFLVAAVVATLLAPQAVARLSRSQRRWGVGLGLVYGGAQVLQTEGLRFTSASVSGFLTGMYVVATPLLGALLLRARVPRTTWLAVALATGGLAVLSLRGFVLGTGELLTLASAVLYAVHIVGLGRSSRAGDALGLTVLQLWGAALVCLVGALPDGVQLPGTPQDMVALLYLALGAGVLAMVAQTWAQARLAPERAAVVMTTEPVWAAVFAVLLGGETLGPRVLVGGVLVLAAMYLVEVRRRSRPGRRGRGRRPARDHQRLPLPSADPAVRGCSHGTARRSA